MCAIEVKAIEQVADAMQIEEIQRDAWNMADAEILPGRFLHAMQFSGACLYGAYDADTLVGFVLGILGTVENSGDRIDQVAAARLQMYSAIMGVRSAYQGSGIGYRLKLAQREFALRIGVRLITWTFDPLESRNAYLNMSKLGVVCQRYFRDFHGELGGINAGLPTDRFFVDWWITSNRVKSKLTKKRAPLEFPSYIDGGATVINAVTDYVNNLPIPSSDFRRSDSNILLVEIPSVFQAIKKQNMPLALAWRNQTRQIFEHYFSRNYLVTDLVRSPGDDPARASYYVLSFGNA